MDTAFGWGVVISSSPTLLIFDRNSMHIHDNVSPDLVI